MTRLEGKLRPSCRTHKRPLHGMGVDALKDGVRERPSTFVENFVGTFARRNDDDDGMEQRESRFSL